MQFWKSSPQKVCWKIAFVVHDNMDYLSLYLVSLLQCGMQSDSNSPKIYLML